MISKPTRLNVANNTVLREKIGPVFIPLLAIRRNKSAATNACYMTVTVRGTGVVKIQGTNDIELVRIGSGTEIRSKDSASWSDLCSQTNTGTTSANTQTDYAMLRCIVTTAGTGEVLLAQAYWD